MLGSAAPASSSRGRPRNVLAGFAVPSPQRPEHAPFLSLSLSLSLRRPSSGSGSVSRGLVGVACRAARRCDVPGVSPGRRNNHAARRCDVPGVSPGRRPATIAGTIRAPARYRGGLFRFGLGALDARQRCAGVVLAWPTTQRPRRLCGAFAPAPRARSLSLSLSLRRPSSGSGSVSRGLVGVACRAARRCDVPGVSPGRRNNHAARRCDVPGVSPGRRPATPPEQPEPPRGIAGACFELGSGRWMLGNAAPASSSRGRPRNVLAGFAVPSPQRPEHAPFLSLSLRRPSSRSGSRSVSRGLFRFGLGALDARQRCAGVVLAWPTTQRPRRLCGEHAPVLSP